MVSTTSVWTQGILSGIGFGYVAVVLSSALAPGMMSIGVLTGNADLTLVTGARILVAPLGVLVLALFGVLAAPLIALVGTPVVILGGGLNGAICLAALGRGPRIRGGAVQQADAADKARITCR